MLVPIKCHEQAPFWRGETRSVVVMKNCVKQLVNLLRVTSKPVSLENSALLAKVGCGLASCRCHLSKSVTGFQVSNASLCLSF